MDHLGPPIGADGAADVARPVGDAAGPADAPMTADAPSPCFPPVAAVPAPEDAPVPRPVGGDPEQAWAVLSAAAVTLAAAPVWRLCDEDLVDRVREFEAVRARLAAHRLTLLRELETRGWAARVGAASTGAWLAQALRCDARAAAADVRAARALDPAGDAPPEPGVAVMTGPA